MYGNGPNKFTYAYDPGGRPLELWYPSSTGIKAYFSGPGGPTLQPGWDGNGQLKHLRYMKGSNLVRRFEFGYDPAGNRITQLDVTPTKATSWAYGYDWLDRLETVKKVETTNTTILAQIQDLPAADALPLMGALQLVSVYSYDAADNRIEFQVPNLSDPALTETFRYSYDFADNITLIEKKIGSGSFSSLETFASDFDGNMTSRTKGGVTTSYQWTDFNRLAAISTSDDSKKQSHTFGVNGFRRKKKDKFDVETTEYATGLATAVSKATGGETITYLMGHRLMGFERSSDGAMFFYLTDSLSSVRDVVRGTDGAVMASYEFAEYGQRISTSESGVSSQKTFVGGRSVQDEVADTGLMMMGHRFYDPSGPAGGTGRFLNRDPIGFRGGLNLFEYAGSSPTSFVDYTGLEKTQTEMLQEAFFGTFNLDNLEKLGISTLEALDLVTGSVKQKAAYYLYNWGPQSEDGADEEVNLVPLLGVGATGTLLKFLKKKNASKELNRILRKHLSSPQTRDCVPTAHNLMKDLKSAGIPARYVNIVSEWDNMMLMTGREAFSNNGRHTAVRIGDHVFDKLTGPTGMEWTEYKTYIWNSVPKGYNVSFSMSKELIP